jgi:hypothetical protein
MTGAARIRKRDGWREKMIRTVAGILEQGVPSKFRYEATCRHDIRHDLCLDGVLWDEADRRAASIVTAALDRIGAVRPTWHEGQLEHTENFEIERRWCIRCGAPIPADEIEGGARKYCGPVCSYNDHHSQWKVEYRDKLRDELHGRAGVARSCPGCGVRFVPHHWHQRLCSPACGYAVRKLETSRRQEEIRRQIPDAQCEVCLSMFRPKRAGSTLCSMQCVGRRAQRLRWGHPVADAVGLQPIECPACKAMFQPVRKESKFCSRECSSQHRATEAAIRRAAE